MDKDDERELTTQELYQSILLGISRLQGRKIKQEFAPEMQDIDEMVWNLVDEVGA